MSEDQLKLLHGYLDGALTEAEMGTLEDLLRSNPEARRTLRSLATIDAKWQEVAAAEAVPGLPAPAASAAPTKPAVPFWAIIGSVAAALAIGFSGWFFRPEAVTVVAPDLGLARIIRAEGTTTATARSCRPEANCIRGTN